MTHIRISLFASDGFAIYQEATGGVLDDNTGLLSFTADQFAALESLFFTINGVTFEFTANAQIFPVRASLEKLDFNELTLGVPQSEAV